MLHHPTRQAGDLAPLLPAEQYRFSGKENVGIFVIAG